MSEPTHSSRVSVSREVLRAELAEMELRLRIWIAAELEEKASAAELAALKGDFAAKVAWAEGLMPIRDRLIEEHNTLMLWRGDALGGHFTDAQEAAMSLTAQKVLEAQQNAGWTRRERLFAATAVFATVIVSVFNVLETTGALPN